MLGIDPVLEPQLHDMPLASGRLLTAGDTQSALVTQTLADQEGYRVGDSVTLNGTVAAGPQAYKIVGIVSGDGPLPEAGGPARLHAADVGPDAVRDDGRDPRGPGRGRRAPRSTSSSASSTSRITTEPYLLSRTADLAASLRSEMADFRSALLLVAAVVLFAGAFLIFNTLSMTVAERTRDVGLLRAAGTTRSQVMGLVLLQALRPRGGGLASPASPRASVWRR